MNFDINSSLKTAITCFSLTMLFLGTSIILPPDTQARRVNRNVNRNVNVNRHVNVHHGYRGGRYRHPIGTAAAVTAAAVVTAAVVGSIVHSLPPSCSSTQVGNVVYQQCGNSWYQPQYSGTTVQYIVVNPPY